MWKQCRICKENKLTSEFNKHQRSKDGLNYLCKACHSQEHRKWKIKNEEKWALQHKVTFEKSRKRNKIFAYQYLETHPCIDCGEDDIEVLEFDHIKEKKQGVSKLINSTTSISRLKEEISKCEIRCCNCHRKKTLQRMGSLRKDFLTLCGG